MSGTDGGEMSAAVLPIMDASVAPRVDNYYHAPPPTTVPPPYR